MLQSQTINLIFFFILVDDLGWTDVSYNGSDFYETYNIDRLSLTSMLFFNAYAAKVQYVLLPELQ